MHPRAVEFRERAAEEYGLAIDVEEFPEGTKTAADAADAVGCEVAQIASSLVFLADGDPVVVVTSGANRVDEDRVAEALDAGAVEMADAETIRETLGWSIGGVPPICHESEVPVLFDPTLSGFDTVWAAAGTPKAVFPIDPDRLKRLAGAAEHEIAV
ncbi:YbaK/EbsC family protein [Halalkalicoccus sp. NIPERK01]|uniref:YbaK/EbsC family protein n=1 Tax=Halalkalicoccus sp. NIPERK01 TaxID=3053469 RepID=UPI00256F0CDD|nr:YbaK/EbsC family protein [Halalkalicoccus sp. NIPERK01]MDL5360795.1 YbaK/EbsC family protein [Halalkalicoccus sp. NIPERK01]